MVGVMVEPRDVPQGSGEFISCGEMLKNTTKFCFACPVEHEANEAFIEMAKAIAKTDDLSKKPFIGMLATMVPGYEIDVEGCKALMIAAREGVPVILMGASLLGAQGPASMASAVVMVAVEQLTGLCIVQAIRKGSPCLWNSGISLFQNHLLPPSRNGTGRKTSRASFASRRISMAAIATKLIPFCLNRMACFRNCSWTAGSSVRASCVFMPRVYRFFPAKALYLIARLIFLEIRQELTPTGFD